MNTSCEKEIQLTDKVKPDVVRIEVSLYKKKSFYMNVYKDSTIGEFYYQLYFTLFPEWYEILHLFSFKTPILYNQFFIKII